MNDTLKITTWNVEWLDRLVDDPTDPKKLKRLKAIAQEIFDINADVYCLLEGVKGEDRIKAFCVDVLQGEYVPVLATDGNYKTSGRQWIWFIVKPELLSSSSLLPATTYDEFAGASWDVHYWGSFEVSKHRHYRHPQVLVLNWHNTRLEFIGLHTKSKFVQGGKSAWNSADVQKKNAFITDAIKARIKMTTEVANVRAYIDRKFQQVANPAIFVMGDLNDGPGKEYFETRFLFFDLLNNLQGSVFEAERYLNHALFDFADELRWTCHFEDFVDLNRNPKILLDHILFTQPLVNKSLPVVIKAKSGLVEHEIHDLINAQNPKYAHTSDHRPVSVVVSKN